MTSNNLRERTTNAILWSGSGQLVSYFIRFVALAILARLLSAEVFGLIGMVMVIVLILRDSSDLGLGAALIQKDDVSKEEYSSIFWTNLGISFLLCIMLVLGAGLIATLLGDDRYTSILRLLAFLLPINALAMVSRVQLKRDLNFTGLSIIDIVGETSFAIVGILLALQSLELLSLIGAVSARWISRAAVTMLISRFVPLWSMDLSLIKNLSGFGISVFGSNLIGRMLSDIDYFFVSRFLGASALGYYTLAFQLVIIPQYRITGMLSGVLFPSFSLVKHDLKRLRRGFLAAIEALALILVPLTVFLFVCAPSLITVLYSDKWSPSATAAQILAIVGLLYGLSLLDTIFLSTGRPNWKLTFQAIRVVLLTIFVMAYGLDFGIEGVAFSLLLAVALSTLVSFLLVARFIELKMREFWQAIEIPIIGGILALIVGLGFTYHFRLEVMDSWQRLLIVGSSVLLTYGIVVLIGYRNRIPQATHWLISKISPFLK